MNRQYLPTAFQYPTDYHIPKNEDLMTDTEHPETNSQCYRFFISQYKDPVDFLPFYTNIIQTAEGLFILATNNFTTCVFNGLVGATYDFNDIVTSNLKNVKYKTLHKENVLNLHCLENTIYLASTSQNAIELYSTKAIVMLEKENHRDIFHILKISRNTTDGRVTCISSLKDDQRFIVGTNKGHIECYEYNSKEMDLMYSMPYAHSFEITGLSSHPSLINNWVSSSSDKSCIMWDRRQLNPATALLSEHRDRLTSVKWYNEETVIASDSAGNLIILDKRQPENILSQQQVAERTITSINFNGNKFGIVSESSVVDIYSINDNKEISHIHKHNAHPNIIYSMCWDIYEKPNTFYVVGENKYAKEITL